MKINNLISLIFLCTSIPCASMERELGEKLLQACRSGNLADVKECIARGAPINYTDEKEGSPLCKALVCRHLDIAQFLLQQPGIDIHRKPADWHTPLHFAVTNTFFYPDSEDRTDKPLIAPETRELLRKRHRAMQLNVIRLLRAKGADINEKSEKEGYTPLHSTLMYRADIAVTRYLVDAGALMQETKETRSTPLQFSRNKPPEYVTAILRSAQITLQDLLKARAECIVAYAKEKESEQSHEKSITELENTLSAMPDRHEDRWHYKNLLSSDEESLKYCTSRVQGYALNSRILQRYYLTMKNMGYVHPSKTEWQYTMRCPFPLEIAKLIAHYAAQYTERTVKLKNLSFESIPMLKNFHDGITCDRMIKIPAQEKLFELFELLASCKKHMQQQGILDEVIPENFDQLQRMQESYVIFGVYENGRAVATFILSWLNRYRLLDAPAHLKYVAVDPHFQGQKIGTWCLQEIEKFAKEEEYAAIQLTCHPATNEFFEKNGFSRIPTFWTTSCPWKVNLEKIIAQSEKPS